MSATRYTKGFKEKIKPKVDPVTREQVIEPFRDAQNSLFRGQFSTRERQEFYDGAFVDIMTQLFTKWLTSEPHAQKEREYLYHVALALGSVKEMMIGYETFGGNMKLMQQAREEAADQKDEDEAN